MMERLIDWRLDETIEVLDDIIRAGDSIRFVWDGEFGFLTESYGQLVEQVVRRYRLLGQDRVTATRHDVGRFIVVIVDPAGGSGPLWGQSVLGVILSRLLGHDPGTPLPDPSSLPSGPVESS